MTPNLDLLQIHRKKNANTYIAPNLDLLQVDQSNRMQTHMWPHDIALLHVDI